ncbi:MAG TPA: Ig-like domain-containing protein [Rhodopila sp.]|nr:Ig-like domain-containing protein [Rhodopila sp.]
MTDHLPATARALPGRAFRSHSAWLGLILTGMMLQGCAQKAAAPGSTTRIYAADVQGGAKQCSVPKLDLSAGKTTEAAMNVGNDGGWCALTVHQPGPKPYDAGLLTSRAAHGSVLIHQVGDDTRIDYTPDRGFAGTDSFTVKLIPGDASIHATVTVTAG